MHSNKTLNVILLSVIAALFFIPFLGRVHLFDWDEINFAECSREMLKLGDYTRVYVDFKPFWEKPPMFFWMQSLAMQCFGVNEFAARFPNAICGIVTLVVIYLCGSRVYDRKFGLLWALAYGGSLFPNMYFKSGIIDPWFNLFIFLSLYYFILYTWKRNGVDKEGLKKTAVTYAIWSGIYMGLAILTKGQVALMIFLMVLGVYFIYNRFRFYFGWGHALLFLVVASLVTATWYGYETAKNGTWFIAEFMKYQYRLFTTHDAGQEGFWGYHYVVLLIGCFPASLFALPSFFRSQYSSRFDKDFKVWMLILFWVVTLLFTIVQSRIIHYSSMAWFPLTFLAAYTFYKWERKELNYKKYVGVLTTILGSIIAIVLLAVPLIGLNIKRLIPYVKDTFAQANMAAEVTWNGSEGLVGIIMVLTLIVGIRMLRKRNYAGAAWTYFGGTALVIFLAAAIIVPKVERYSQGAAIDFFEARQGEDCYVKVLGYWSYAPFFYTHKEKPTNENSYNEEWLLTGNIDKPVYFVTKVDRVNDYAQYTSLKELYRKNGFVFLKREPVQH
ncbi:ArnT family glycosyltransferase [Chitinophaga nivalis]|uniref:Glycosyltransferase family 39 protein n=1 Tax=Chitinophaga nivalis TaxID=2991709 RepID=A0ABT3IQB7_9BACT|nr:glycosyltransferase family 39 protein [Chitinophaga nivalis]MCW3464182.1 glycosyltransferase family 39 protein [Chitinophaga nivalis]MCW3486128.1 glycosyltransferase family 39 protein [Chitinophaga nivalis]